MSSLKTQINEVIKEDVDESMKTVSDKNQDLLVLEEVPENAESKETKSAVIKQDQMVQVDIKVEPEPSEDKI